MNFTNTDIKLLIERNFNLKSLNFNQAYINKWTILESLKILYSVDSANHPSINRPLHV